MPSSQSKLFHFVQALEQDGSGKVLVVDGGASLRCALLGDNLAEMAYKNRWSVRASPSYIRNWFVYLYIN